MSDMFRLPCGHHMSDVAEGKGGKLYCSKCAANGAEESHIAGALRRATERLKRQEGIAPCPDCAARDAEIAQLGAQVLELTQERDEARELNDKVQCLYCGEIHRRSELPARELAQHMLTCEKHPIRKMMDTVQELEAVCESALAGEVTALEDALEFSEEGDRLRADVTRLQGVVEMLKSGGAE
jgi:hypothetical protein